MVWLEGRFDISTADFLLPNQALLERDGTGNKLVLEVHIF